MKHAWTIFFFQSPPTHPPTHLSYFQIDVQLVLPFPYADAEGNIPVKSTILFSNPNPFPATTEPAHIEIYALPTLSAQSHLSTAALEKTALRYTLVPPNYFSFC